MQGCVTGQERYTVIRQASGRCCNCLGLPLSLLRRGESCRKSRLANCRRNRVYRENYRSCKLRICELLVRSVPCDPEALPHRRELNRGLPPCVPGDSTVSADGSA